DEDGAVETPLDEGPDRQQDREDQRDELALALEAEAEAKAREEEEEEADDHAGIVPQTPDPHNPYPTRSGAGRTRTCSRRFWRPVPYPIWPLPPAGSILGRRA